MKRPPGLWLLLSAGVLCLTLQSVYGLRATELIFKKSTTTSTTEGTNEGQKDGVTEAAEPPESTTKSNFTGNPQLDYIYDPNLPRELNGYNLSSYPFYNSMPEDIDFKCDGLHDGFYASVPHKCQVYHHCLFGTRFDFLCANYTAFDQKTFICHFVSEVDCTNSHKYWHRNDALYQTATTTTQKSTTVVISPALTASPRRPPPGIRRPRPSRRRPSYDYYEDEYTDDPKDDYYEEPPRRRRKRPRPRPRPIYDDDYEYEDDRYERRGTGRRHENRRDPEDDRRPYMKDEDDRRAWDDDRHSSRNHNKKEHDADRDTHHERKPYNRKEGESEVQDKKNDDDRRKSADDRRKNDDDRRKNDDDRRKDEDDRRYDDDKRYKDERRRDHDDRTRFDQDEDDYGYENRKRRPISDDHDDRRPYHDKRRPDNRRPIDRPRKRRPYDDYDDSEEDRRGYDRPRSNSPAEKDDKSLVRPNSGSSVYNQPRMAPKIRPPVPKGDQNKFTPKTTTEKPANKKYEDEADYEEEYDEPLPPKRTTLKPDASENRRPSKVDKDDRRRPLGSASRSRIQTFKRPVAELVDEYQEDKPKHPRPQIRSKGEASNSRGRQKYDNEPPPKEDITTKSPLLQRERNQSLPKFISKDQRREKTKIESTTVPTTTTTITTTTSTTTTPKELIRERVEPVIRVVKRPFLPSRGGNPYSSRGLQPIGSKALQPEEEQKPTYDEDYPEEKPDTHAQQNGRQFPSEAKGSTFLINEEQGSDELLQEKPVFKPSPVLIKVPVRVKYDQGPLDEEEEFRPVSNRPQSALRQPTKPKNTIKYNTDERNPLDINENEYDVTLNDALNPTIPNLPIRNFPSSFSPSTDYTYSSFNRPRYDVALNQASENRYQIRAPSQRIETVIQPFGGGGKKFGNTAQYTVQQPEVYQNFRSSPQITQAQSQAFYSVY